MDHAAPAWTMAPPAADAHLDPVWDASQLFRDLRSGTRPRDGDTDRRAWAADYEEIE